MKDLSLISLKLSKANKNLRKFSRQWQTNNSPFEVAPYRDTNQIMVGGRISRRCSPKITHHWKPGQQQHQNKYRPQFHGYRGKTLSFKSSTTKQNFLELPSLLQCKQSASICKGFVYNKSSSRSTSSRETKILLFKLDQTYTKSEYPKYCSKNRDSFSWKPCAGKITQPSSFESGTIQACQGGNQGNVVKRCNTSSITMQ